MKLNFSDKKNCAMNIVEVLTVICCLVLLAAMSLPMFAPRKHVGESYRLSNLKQVSVAFRIWSEDENNQYPMGISATNGGAMELIGTGNVASVFQVMYNELSTTKILVCPDDLGRTFATNWSDLNGSHISYFLGADASNDVNSGMVMDGDDDLLIAGIPAKSGLLEFSSKSPVVWSGKRHGLSGCIGFADGRAYEESQSVTCLPGEPKTVCANRVR